VAGIRSIQILITLNYRSYVAPSDPLSVSSTLGERSLGF
jgi:hypothetical protein